MSCSPRACKLSFRGSPTVDCLLAVDTGRRSKSPPAPNGPSCTKGHGLLPLLSAPTPKRAGRRKWMSNPCSTRSCASPGLWRQGRSGLHTNKDRLGGATGLSPTERPRESIPTCCGWQRSSSWARAGRAPQTPERNSSGLLVHCGPRTEDIITILCTAIESNAGGTPAVTMLQHTRACGKPRASTHPRSASRGTFHTASSPTTGAVTSQGRLKHSTGIQDQRRSSAPGSGLP